jgi:hypothetical protein
MSQLTEKMAAAEKKFDSKMSTLESKCSRLKSTVAAARIVIAPIQVTCTHF